MPDSMQELSVPRLIAKRLIEDWQILAGTMIGMIAATTLAALAPLYLDSLEQLAFEQAITRISRQGSLRVDVFAPPLLLQAEAIDGAEQSVVDALNAQAAESYQGHETYIRGANSLVGLPNQPLPAEGGTGARVARGFVQHVSNLDRHASLVSGRMNDTQPPGAAEPNTLEAVISVQTAERFMLGPGDTVEVTPDLRVEERLYVTITGVVEPDDPSSNYWGFAGLLLDPAPLLEVPPEGVTVAGDDEEEPPVALLATRSAIVDVVGGFYPSTVVRPVWFSFIDSEQLTAWSIAEVRERFEGLEIDVTDGLPGAQVGTRSVLTPIETIERRSFFTKIPLLLLLALMGVTILFYLATVVVFLAGSRERDSAVLRSRGVGLIQLSRIYFLEGAAMAVVATVVGPLLAIAAVSVAGLLPYFSVITGFGLLPLVLTLDVILLAAGAGLLCLGLFVAAAVLGTKGGVVMERVQAARPNALPFFHRYYLDAVVLVFGGMIFWELQSRGQFVSGGLFQDLEVNETLLFAPVAFLVVVALLFMRLFPMVVRFIAGESVTLLHVASGASVAAIVLYTIWKERLGLFAAEPMAAVLGALVFGLAYAATHLARRTSVRVGAYLAQAAIAAAMFVRVLPSVDEVLYTPVAALSALVFGQVLFLLLVRLTTATPAWMSLALWHMARSPVQYTWVILLLVLANGLALLATTVGGTLERSQRERVLYDIGSDIHVADVRASRRGGLSGLESDIEEVPGVATVSRGYRTSGDIGSLTFELLGVEPGEFAFLTWYRPDFSARPLNAVMGELAATERLDPIILPEGARTIGAYVKGKQKFRNLSVWAQVRDPSGWISGISLGKIRTLEWSLLSAEIPERLRTPLELVALHLSEPGQGNLNTPGNIFIDDIHVTTGESTEEVLLEGFEGAMSWLPIVGSYISGDLVERVAEEAQTGSYSAHYEFGRESIRGIRGIYRLPTNGAVPAVIDSRLARNAGIEVGDVFMSRVTSSLVPVEVAEIIENFPTMRPGAGSFMIVEIDSILGHLNVLGSSYQSNPNEFFVGKVPGEDPVGDITSIVRFTARVYDRDAEMEAVASDPLTGAGWKAMVLLSLVVALVAASFTYASYLLQSGRKSRAEVGFLESLGLSRLQLGAMLVFEHLAVVAIGLGLGTWAGFLMSRMMAGSLAVTEEGAAVTPPFLLITDWALMAPTYLIMAVVFLSSLLGLWRSVGNLDLQAIARLGET